MPQGFFKNVNIITEIDKNNTNDFVDFYIPGSNSNASLAGVRYSGFITSLRAVIDIKSIDALVLPNADDFTTQTELDNKTEQVITASPKKCMEFYLKNLALAEPVKVGELWIFNRLPYYFVDLIRYFTSATTFDVAPDTIVSIKIKDMGFGTLLNTDKISIIGSAVEEASAFIE